MIYVHLYPTALTPLCILNSKESVCLSVHPRVCSHYLNSTNGSLVFLASNLQMESITQLNMSTSPVICYSISSLQWVKC